MTTRQDQAPLSARRSATRAATGPWSARLAAKGARVPPSELATVLFALTRSRRRGQAQARDSLESLPEPVCDAVLAGETHPAVLSYLAHAFKDHAGRLEKLALNPATDDRTFVFLAGLPHRRVVEIVANNQTRLLRCSEIAERSAKPPAGDPHRSRAELPRSKAGRGGREDESEGARRGADAQELTASRGGDARLPRRRRSAFAPS